MLITSEVKPCVLVVDGEGWAVRFLLLFVVPGGDTSFYLPG